MKFKQSFNLMTLPFRGAPLQKKQNFYVLQGKVFEIVNVISLNGKDGYQN